MDRATIAICRIDVAMNGLLTAQLKDSEIEELESKIVGIIDKATHRRTPRFLKKCDNKESIKEGILIKEKVPEESMKKSSVSTVETATPKKRVRWDCNTCISKGDKEKDTSGICFLCEQIYKRNGKTNYYYQRKPKVIPSNCGECEYKKWTETYRKNICIVNCKCEGENHNTHHPIRANYLSKNRPNFCKF